MIDPDRCITRTANWKSKSAARLVNVHTSSKYKRNKNESSSDSRDSIQSRTLDNCR
jgi:hypothetical protein